MLPLASPGSEAQRSPQELIPIGSPLPPRATPEEQIRAVLGRMGRQLVEDMAEFTRLNRPEDHQEGFRQAIRKTPRANLS